MTSSLLTLTPQLLARIQALGFDGTPSDALAWLVSCLEEQRSIAHLSTAWNEGASAQCAGLPRHAVPYLPDSEEGAAWLAGWTADAWSPGGRLHRELAEDAEKLRRSRNFHVAHLNEIRAVLSDPSHVVDGGFDSAGKVAAMARELQAVKAARDEARATAEELRLTLAAEQGKFECLPFSSPPRLRAAVNAERILRGLSWRELAAQIGVSSSGFTRWNAGHDLSVPAYLKVCDWLRAAMIAADKATETP